MSDTFRCMPCHIVFSTKNRMPFIEPEIEQEIWSFMGSMAKQMKVIPLEIGGAQDHVHMLLSTAPNILMSEVVCKIKCKSSFWVKQRFPCLRGFTWQKNYGIFNVSESLVPRVANYIHNQKKHHLSQSYADEFRELLEKHHIKYDERYYLK